jgi:putative protease
MAARKKGRGKAKTTARKAKAARKRPAKKAPARRASPKKARPTAKAAAKRKPARPRAKPKAARPTPGLPARPAPPGERLGVVTHYFDHPCVAVVRLECGSLRIGDVIHFQGHTTDFRQTVDSLEVDHAPVNEVGPNDDFGLKVAERVREHDVVYKVRP